MISFIDFLYGGCCCCCCCLGHSLFFALLLSLFPGDFCFSLLYTLHAFPSISSSFCFPYVLFAFQFNFVFLTVVIALLPWDSFPLFASYTLSTCILTLVSLSSLYSACISIHLSSFSFYIPSHSRSIARYCLGADYLCTPYTGTYFKVNTEKHNGRTHKCVGTYSCRDIEKWG